MKRNGSRFPGIAVAVLSSALLLVMVCSTAALGSGEIKWTKDGIPMTRMAGDNFAPQVIPDGSGGAIVLWMPSAPKHPFAQRVDEDGNLLWPADGVDLFPTPTGVSSDFHAIPDGSGGAFVVCSVNGIGVSGQHVEADGSLAWTDAGKDLRTGSNSSDGLRMCPDGSGGFIAAWSDKVLIGDDYDIMAERMNASGVKQWNTIPGGGTYIYDGPGQQTDVQVAKGAGASAIVAWQDDRNIDEYVYAQRMKSDGSRAWAAAGVQLGAGGWTDQEEHGICRDGSGGAIVAWQGNAGTGPDILAQRVSSTGAALWQAGGAHVCTADQAQWRPQVATDGQGGAFIAWDDFRDNDVYCQHMDMNGAALWTADGFQVTVAPEAQREVQIAPDGLGGVILAWQDARHGLNYEIYAQRLTAAGGEAWTAGGLQVLSLDGGYCIPAVANTDPGDAIVAWEDQRNWKTTGSDAYAQRIVSVGGDIPADWYFAEGTTRPGFEQYISIQNSNAAQSDVKITYMLEGGVTQEQTLSVPGRSRSTVVVADFLGVGVDNSSKVETTNNVPVVAERPMYFAYGTDHGLYWPGGHDVVGVNQPRDTWYFAEGTTRPGFEQYICLQNPTGAEADVTITYMLANSQTQTQDLKVGANSRITVAVHGVLGVGHDNSASVESTNGVDIVAERPQYFDYGPGWTGGHCVFGTEGASENWYFAEGTTRPEFSQYICLQNPENQQADVKITYMMAAGQTSEQTQTVPPQSRVTVTVVDHLGLGVDNSAKVESTNGVKIVAERPMYFDYKAGEPGYSWTGGHDVVGTTTPRDTWFFAEGTIRSGFEEWICLQNPSNNPTEAYLTYMLDDGTNDLETVDLPANSRVTVSVNDFFTSEHDLSVRVESIDGTDIIVERPMYFNYKAGEPGYSWTGGHDVMGY